MDRAIPTLGWVDLTKRQYHTIRGGPGATPHHGGGGRWLNPLNRAYTMHEARAKAHRTRRSDVGERVGGGPERQVSGFGRPLRGGGVRWSQTHMSYRPRATPQ